MSDTRKELILLRDGPRPKASRGSCQTMADLRQRWRQAGMTSDLFRYSSVTVRVAAMQALRKPFLSLLLARILSRGPCWLEDASGKRESITLATLLGAAYGFVRDSLDSTKLLREIDREIKDLEHRMPNSDERLVWNPAGAVAYLRTDLVLGQLSGGSVSHVAGVLNHLDEHFSEVLFFTTDCFSTVRPDLEQRILPLPERFWNHADYPALAANERFFRRCQETCESGKLALVYQRYSLNDFTGLRLARTHGVPLVLEYNGSELWLRENWGEAISPRLRARAERIELLNLQQADLVVVVSKPSRDELIARGVAADRILVNPNGVDADRFSPAVDGSEVQQQYDLNGKFVIGFIGTFGAWHGAEVLAEAIGLLRREAKVPMEKIRLLFVGDGDRMPATRQLAERLEIADCCVFTGMIPHAASPAHLAACDVLVSPQVPNPDGSPFFGSPTKLFEYLAMEKPIVASDLDQIGEVLTHEVTALLTRPGDAASLAAALTRLYHEPALARQLAKAAREEALRHYTWKQHTARIIEAIRKRCLAAGAVPWSKERRVA